MPTIEERVAFIEGQMSEQSHALIELRDAVRQPQSGTAGRRAPSRPEDGRAIRSRGSSFRVLDDKISRQFIWLVGVQVTTLVAIVGALLARS